MTAGIVSAPLALFKKYKGVELKATVLENGTVEFDGRVYDSCSTAGAYARGTVVGGAPSTNGWSFWKYHDSNGVARVLDFARQAYLQRPADEC